MRILLFRHKTRSFLTVELEKLATIEDVREYIPEEFPGWGLVTSWKL